MDGVLTAPVPMLEEKSGRFFARWSHHDAQMRSRNRSVLETADRIDTVEDAFLAALRTDDGEVRWPSRAALRDFGRRLAMWRLDRRADAGQSARITFRLVAPPANRRRVASDDLRSSTWRLKLAAPPDSAEGFRALGAACQACPALRGMRDDCLDMDQAEVEAFILAGAPALRAAGYGVEIAGGSAAEITAEASISSASAAKTSRSSVSVKSRTLRAKVVIRVAGQKVSRSEIAFLLEQGSSMVFFRGRWIEVDRGILKSALKVLDDAEAKMTGREAVAFACRLQRARGLASVRVKGTGWFGKVLEDLRAGGRFRPLSEPKGFKGRLRAYQKRGYAWLKHLTDRGFGALLADDMVLGKTIQAIAWFLKRRATGGGGRALVVAPVSVTMNWMRELERFAPSVKTLLHQGRGRLVGESFVRAAAECDVVVTGYPLFVKDFGSLSGIGFDALILDEAQTIKNPDTRIARTARAFPCADRIALTGTPFENCATDLWSIEEFLNPGLLGPRSEFERDFVRPLREGDAAGALAELKKTLTPFLLRRLKSDPGIAKELGPKREIREYCLLSPQQRAAYEVALARYAALPPRVHGEKGGALALLTELKLVCDGLSPNGALQGGKVDRLLELLDEIFNAGESALVFTQYVRVGERLRALIEGKFSRRVPILHGGLSPAAREAQIAAFNEAKAPTAFVLSLKAGGFGLNLTKATHVIHFDRWWNPATESQATDRAHRIGQANTVFVHLFISCGTLEDRIDAMLRSKRVLADELVASGESFLLRLSQEEFRRTVALGGV